MMNNVSLTGRLVKEPELRYTPNGVAVATFTLAVNRPWQNENGDREADFIQHVAFKGTAEAVGNYLKKGSLVGIEGRIQTRNYEKEDPAGNYTVWVTEVLVNQLHFLEKKQEDDNGQQNNRNNQRGNNRNQRGGRK